MNESPPAQLPLKLSLRESATFAGFFPAGNEAAVHALRQATEPYVFLAGVEGSGKTHLLQAACHAARESGASSAYIPLARQDELSPGVLEGLEHVELVCLDDVDAVAGNATWELALFNLFNQIHGTDGRLLITGSEVPTHLPIGLADLASRLTWGPVFQLRVLADEHKTAALQLRAASRGVELPDEVATYLLRRCPRDLTSLFALLDRLDTASLAAQRRLTIPFVRQFV